MKQPDTLAGGVLEDEQDQVVSGMQIELIAAGSVSTAEDVLHSICSQANRRESTVLRGSVQINTLNAKMDKAFGQV